MTRKFRRATLYVGVVRYAVNAAVWWVQHRPVHRTCARCGAVDNPGTRPPVFAVVDEYRALLNAMTGLGKNRGMRRRVLELLVADSPFTVTIGDPKRERN
jgi:hypothetical protein